MDTCNAGNPSSPTTMNWRYGFLFSVLFPITIAITLFYHLDTFDPTSYPDHEFSNQASQVQVVPPHITRWMLGISERIANGQVLGPEDMVYNQESGVMYAGCADGWIKQVRVDESGSGLVVENLVNTGGRPLGLALGRDEDELVVADADKGLLKLTKDNQLVLLSDEAEGHIFKLTDGIAIANDGTIYFTDASYKYNLKESTYDILEGRPHGRLLSYDPKTKNTKVLVSDLYFPNGVAISPNQDSVIFCETPMRRCKKYFLHGNNKGSTEIFVDNLPGTPDNIHYDGQGYYWIGIPTSTPCLVHKAMRYRQVRKALAIIEKHIGLGQFQKYGGVMAVDEKGKQVIHFYDLRLSMITSGIRIRNHLYCGSLASPYILRIDLTKYLAGPLNQATIEQPLT